MQAFLAETKRQVSLKKRSKSSPFETAQEWGENFRSLIGNPEGRQVFKDFLTKEHAEENLLFWEAVQVFRALKEEQLNEFAVDLFDQFVSVTATTQVSLDSANRRKVEATVEELRKEQKRTPARSLFDDAEHHIYKLLESDSWRRFTLSPEYQKKMISKFSPEVVNKWSKSFQSLLHSRFGLQLFCQFLDKEHAAENIYFWQEVQLYKSLKNGTERKQCAKKIWDRYLDPASHSEISVDYQTRTGVQRRLEEAAAGLFDGAEAHIFQLMAKDSFPRFLRSDFLRAIQEEHRKTKADSEEASK